MSVGEYVPGGHLAVVDVHGVALLPAETSDSVLDAVRSVLGPDEPEGDRVATLLETLTLGTRLSVLPPFAAAVIAPGRVDVLVRGPYQVAVAGSRPIQIDGLHVTSWREASVDEPTRIELNGDGVDSTRSLTLDRGVALAGSVRLTLVPVGELPQVEPTPEDSRAQPGPDGAGAQPAPEAPGSQPAPEAPGAEPARGGLGAEPVGRPADVPPIVTVPGDVPVVPVGAPESTSAATGVDEDRTLLPDATLAMEQTGADERLVTGVPGPDAVRRPDRSAEGSGETDYGFLWDHTIVQDVEHAAVRANTPDLDQVAGVDRGAGVEPDAGDHDGETIHLADLLGAAPVPARAPVPAAAEVGGAAVLSRYCTQGHPNAPHAVGCRECGSPIVGEPRVGARPALGRLRLVSGETVDLDRSVILGRRPQASRISQGDIPRLVAVGGKEVSRSHLEVRVEDWYVLAVELGSRNGTLLRRPGQPPVRLVENSPVPVRSGDQFDLGEGIVVTAEDVP